MTVRGLSSRAQRGICFCLIGSITSTCLTEIQHVPILKGGMGKKQRQAVTEKLASIPDGTPRGLLATGSYIGEGFDDSRLDTHSLTMPSRGAGLCNNMSGGCIGFITGREWFEYATTFMRKF